MKKPLDVIFMDNHLLVVNKPSGLLTQETNQEKKSLQNFCKDYLKNQYSKPGNVFCEPIHRLDKDVSGLVVFARTSKALSRLNDQIKKRAVSKRYIALVEGVLDGFEVKTLTHYLIKGNYRTSVFETAQEESKKASLLLKPLKKLSGKTVVDIELITGRYHQIRAQLAFIGHPVVGDVKYGAKKSDVNWIALHHKSFSLDHPTTKKRLSWTVDPAW